MTTETIDRRSAIESAFEEAEKQETAKSVAEPTTPIGSTEQIEKTPGPSSATSAEKQLETTNETVEKTEQTGQSTSKPEKEVPVDRAPQSWRAPQKAKWASIDPEVRQEVMRRERDVTKVLGESGQARHFVQQFHSTLQPYADRIQSMGVEPIRAIQGLLEADRILSSAPANQKAAYMAKLINDYRIDVAELDNALSGTVTADPVASKVEALLAQRMAPINQYLTRQQQEQYARQQQEQYARQQQEAQTMQTIETMANDPNYEYFNDVRNDMADIIDLQAKKGIYLTLDQAYNRAIAMNPEVNQLVTNRQATESNKQSALAQHARAQKALQASKSVGGSPSGLSSGASGSLDRRAVIEAAFDAAGGR